MGEVSQANKMIKLLERRRALLVKKKEATQQGDATSFIESFAPGLMEFRGLTQILPQRQAAPSEEISPPLFGEAVGAAMTPGMLPAVGETAGSMVPGVARPFTAAGGAMAGRALENIIQGQPTTTGVGMEGLLSLVPEAAETAVRTVGRNVLRGTKVGQQMRFSEAARLAREVPGQTFDPPQREAVGRLFDMVRQSGVRLDISNVRGHISGLRQGKFDDLFSEVQRIDRNLKSGGRFSNVVQNLRTQQGARVTGFDIGELQTLRSELRKRRLQLEPPEAKQLLRDLQDEVDDAIDFGLARGRVPAGQTPAILKEARVQYARLRSAEELGDMVERSITSTPDLSDVRFNLRQIADNLRRNTSKQSQAVNRALDLTPGARQRFQSQIDEISKQFQAIELSLADVSGTKRLFAIAGLNDMIGSILSTETGRRMFQRSVLEGRGRLSANAIAVILSAVRRDLSGSPQSTTEETQPRTLVP